MQKLENTEKAYLDSLELLNKQGIERERTILNSKQFRLGASMVRYGTSILKLNIAQLIRDLRKRHNAKLAARVESLPTVLPEVRFNNNAITSKIAVYTCVTGGYDSVVPPLVHFQNVDFFLFTDGIASANKELGPFVVKQIPESILALGNVMANRYMKMHPYEFLAEYDYTIYIDGNIQVVGDIRQFVETCPPNTGIAMHTHRERNCLYKEAEVCMLLGRGNKKAIGYQMSRYKQEVFPENFGLNEANVIVCNMSNPQTRKLMNAWWAELEKSESLRDQLAWPYVLWKNKLGVSDIGNLGGNVMKNYKIRVRTHD